MCHNCLPDDISEVELNDEERAFLSQFNKENGLENYMPPEPEKPDTRPFKPTWNSIKNTFTYARGVTLSNIHPAEERCWQEGCVIHNPTNHSMREFPLHWRSDRRLMERICPHGIGHPDPDHMNWYRSCHSSESTENELTHGCDGCCRGAYHHAL